MKFCIYSYIARKELTAIQEIIKRQAEQVAQVKQHTRDIEEAKRTLEENFGSLANALSKINNIKSSDPTAIALQQVRKTTESFQRTMEKYQQDLATINPLTGAVRKQKFKRPALTNQLVKSLEAKVDSVIKEEKQNAFKGLANLLQKKDYKKKVETKADGTKRTHLYFGYGKGGEQGGDFYDWLWDNEVHGLFSIVKHYKKNKSRYTPVSWEDLCQILRSLNFKPKEVLEYSISKIQTKEKFLEHRLYRNIEARNASGLEDFIDIYKKFLKTKKPFKVFFHSKALANWCAMEDIFFKSEENCRVNKTLMVEAYNKKYPQDKISDKKRK